jgi:cytochrome P450
MTGGCPMSLPTTRTTPFDPPAALAALRAEEPVSPLRYPDGHVGWLVTGYDLARAVLNDARFSVGVMRSVVGHPVETPETLGASDESDALRGRMDFADAPEHGRLRHGQLRHFRISEIGRHRDAIEHIVDEPLAAMAQLGPPVDFVHAFALPISSLAICHILGVPGTDRHYFEEPTSLLMDPRSSYKDRAAAALDFRAYTERVIGEKRAEPGDDLLSELIGYEDFDDEDLPGIVQLLFEAGHETTANMLSLSVLALLSEQDGWQRLHGDPAAIEAAVEELLRYLTIVQTANVRTALEPVELGDVVVEAGQSVAVSLAAGNRDPVKFSDPDALDLRRDARGHLAFGYGPHMCLGQHLARLELRIALAKLVDRFPSLHLAADAGEAEFVDDERFIYGVRNLPVTWLE